MTFSVRQLMKKPNCFFFILLTVGVMIRILTALYLPIFNAPDEEPHYKYIQYLHYHQQLPVAYSATGENTNDWEYYQPPLYYLICSFFLFKDPILSFYAIRFFSVVLFAVSLIFSNKFLEQTTMAVWQKRIALVLITFLPTYIFVSSTVNNDNLIITLTVSLIYILQKLHLESKRNALLIGIIVGMAVLTKLSAFVIAFYTASIYSVNFLKKKKVAYIFNLTVVAIVAFLISFPFFVRNYSLYANITGPGFVNKLNNSTNNILYEILLALNESSWTFYSVAGIHNDIRAYNWPFGYLLFALLGYGLAHVLMRKCSIHLKVFAACILLNFLFIVWFGHMYNQAQGRFFLPSLLFISVIITTGLKQIAKNSKYFRTELIVWSTSIFFLLGFVLNILKIEMHRSQNRLPAIKADTIYERPQKRSPK